MEERAYRFLNTLKGTRTGPLGQAVIETKDRLNHQA